MVAEILAIILLAIGVGVFSHCFRIIWRTPQHFRYSMRVSYYIIFGCIITVLSISILLMLYSLIFM